MPLSDRPELANLIVGAIRGYAIIILSPDGKILDWLGDSEAITGYAPGEAINQHFELLFTEPDRLAGAAGSEIEIAVRDGRAEDSRWHLRKDGRRFWANGLTMSMGPDEALLIKVFRDETPSKLAEEQRVLLLNELNHRVKNTLATVQSVVDQTLRAAGIGGDLRGDLADRLLALARAHNVLVEQSWAGADLDALLREVAQPYQRTPSPFAFDGPPTRLHPSQAVSLSLALHELATNAVKYGALSAPEGHVYLSWNLAQNGDGDRFLTLLWRETDGPKVVAPARTGFGTRLLAQTFGDHNGGHSVVRYLPDGVTCVMSLKLTDADHAENPSLNLLPEVDAAHRT